MKNIFILPTDKPSSIWINYVADRLIHGQFTSNDTKINCQNQHIYITSDEEIKAGNWTINSIGELNKYKGGVFFTTWKKVILSTDQDLIADGVQAIDDEFLEWFVKNPSCEDVKVMKEKVDLSDLGYYKTYYKYKIIIPKQEPSIRLKNSLTQFNMSLEEAINLNPVELQKIGFGNRSILELKTLKEESKQETLEEAAETELYITINKIIDGGKDLPKGYSVTRGQAVDYAFKIALEVAKWQQERSYYDEEVKFIINKLAKDCYFMQEPNQNIAKWFKQFKKK